MSDVKFVSIEMDRSEQTILISSDVKNDVPTDQISRGEGLTQMNKRVEVGTAGDAKPAKERFLGVGMG